MVRITDQFLTKTGPIPVLEFFAILQRRFRDGWIPKQAHAFIDQNYGGAVYIDRYNPGGFLRYSESTHRLCYNAGILDRTQINEGSDEYYGRGKRYKYRLKAPILPPDPTSLDSECQKRVLAECAGTGMELLVRKIIKDGRFLSFISRVKRVDPIAYELADGPYWDTLLEKSQKST